MAHDLQKNLWFIVDRRDPIIVETPVQYCPISSLSVGKYVLWFIIDIYPTIDRFYQYLYLGSCGL